MSKVNACRIWVEKDITSWLKQELKGYMLNDRVTPTEMNFEYMEAKSRVAEIQTKGSITANNMNKFRFNIIKTGDHLFADDCDENLLTRRAMIIAR